MILRSGGGESRWGSVLHLPAQRAPQQRAGGGLQWRRLRHRRHTPHPGHMVSFSSRFCTVRVTSAYQTPVPVLQWGQRPGPGGGAAAVWRQPDCRSAGVRSRVPGLLWLLCHCGAAVVRPSLAVPPRHQDDALHGPAQHLLSGVRRWPASGLPANPRVSRPLPQRAGGHPDQLCDCLLCRDFPAGYLGGGALHRAGEPPPGRVVRRPRARLHAG